MSIKKYSYSKDKNKNITPHFKVYEFASFINGKLYSDEILIDLDFINKLEEIITICNCSKAIISSGYRTNSADRDIGGTGTGQHVLGRAVDICFYDQNNKIIPSQFICCIAQDLDFKGIAYITESYVHLDNREIGTYKGDERTGNSTVTNNFYNYFNLNKSDIDKYLVAHPNCQI